MDLFTAGVGLYFGGPGLKMLVCVFGGWMFERLREFNICGLASLSRGFTVLHCKIIQYRFLNQHVL